ncbi:MAG: hypothetical protein NTY01_23930 [Verrucomicrobia bacterium]|nr:hypothetical protein [Verrucomicrobiota bacterium]
MPALWISALMNWIQRFQHHARRSGAGGAEKVPDNLVQPRHLGLGDAHGLLERRAFVGGQVARLAVEQLEVDVQRVERIADLVGDAGREERHRLVPLAGDGVGAFLARGGHVAEDEHGAAARGGERHGVQVQETRLRVEHLDLAAEDAGLAVAGGVPFQVRQVAPQRQAEGRLLRHTEQFRGGFVEIGDTPPGVSDDDALGERIEHRLEETLLARELAEVILHPIGIEPAQLSHQLLSELWLH